MLYHSYIFFDIDKSIRDFPPGKLNSWKKAFIETIQVDEYVTTYSYTTLGLKSNTVFMLWFQSDSLDMLQNLLNEIMHTNIGRYLIITQTLVGMTRATQYSSSSTTHLYTERKGGKYLTIYPFTKTYDWYSIGFEKRKDLMKGHASVGAKYPQITQILLYSYGIDDSEFIVSYETDDLPDFQKLVMDLRSDPVRAYTLKDTPIYTCIYRSFDETMEFI